MSDVPFTGQISTETEPVAWRNAGEMVPAQPRDVDEKAQITVRMDEGD
jgi:hypothetical protein